DVLAAAELILGFRETRLAPGVAAIPIRNSDDHGLGAAERRDVALDIRDRMVRRVSGGRDQPQRQKQAGTLEHSRKGGPSGAAFWLGERRRSERERVMAPWPGTKLETHDDPPLPVMNAFQATRLE